MSVESDREKAFLSRLPFRVGDLIDIRDALILVEEIGLIAHNMRVLVGGHAAPSGEETYSKIKYRLAKKIKVVSKA